MNKLQLFYHTAGEKSVEKTFELGEWRYDCGKTWRHSSARSNA